MSCFCLCPICHPKEWEQEREARRKYEAEMDKIRAEINRGLKTR